MSLDEKELAAKQVDTLESSEADAATAEIDPVAEKRLLRKMDIRIVPFLFVLYTMSFLDRINVGNAYIQGMKEELELDIGDRFNQVLMFFYITYITLEVPSNMLLKKSRPNLYIAGLMFSWGITCMCMGFVNNYKQLIGLRVLLGVFEAGVLPSVIFLVPMYYRRDEVQRRMGIILTSTIVSGAFAGLLAYGIAEMSGLAGYLGWRWIFIVEGAFTAFLALFAPFILVGYPEKMRFLTRDEKALLFRRRALDQEEFHMDTLNRHAVKLILRDPTVWCAGFAFLGLGCPGLITFQFLPTVLAEFGWKGKEAQIRTVPIYMAGAVVAYSVSIISDKLRHRYCFILLGLFIATIGFGMMLNQEHLSRGAKYAAAFLIPAGGWTSMFVIISWPTINLSGRWKRAIAAGMQLMIGGSVGPITSYIFVQGEKPHFRTLFRAGLGLMWFGALNATAMFLYWWNENRLRAKGKRDYRLSQPEEIIKNMGDDHPGYRYGL